jgi:hypothetical protein
MSAWMYSTALTSRHSPRRLGAVPVWQPLDHNIWLEVAAGRRAAVVVGVEGEEHAIRDRLLARFDELDCMPGA